MDNLLQCKLEIDPKGAQKTAKAAQTKLEAVEQRLAEAENDLIAYKTELIRVREYANHAVPMANEAWRDGASTIEYRQAQLYGAAVAPRLTFQIDPSCRWTIYYNKYSFRQTKGIFRVYIGNS